MIEVAIEAARAAGEIIKESYLGTHAVHYKDSHNVVSQTDVAAEKKILKIISATFPDHGIFSEEAGTNTKHSDYLWVIDPLDGTTNFINGLPYFGVSVALLHENQVVVGVVLDPLRDELFCATHTSPAQLNGSNIKQREPASLPQSVIGLSRGASAPAKMRHGKIYQEVVNHIRTTRVIGSTALALCYAAAGRLQATIINDSPFYDYAAGLLIAQQAGLRVTDFAGQQPALQTTGVYDIIAATPKIHASLLTILNNASL